MEDTYFGCVAYMLQFTLKRMGSDKIYTRIVVLVAFWLGSLSRKLLGSRTDVGGSSKNNDRYPIGVPIGIFGSQMDLWIFGSRVARVGSAAVGCCNPFIVLEIVFDCHLVVIVLTVVQ